MNGLSVYELGRRLQGWERGILEMEPGMALSVTTFACDRKLASWAIPSRGRQSKMQCVGMILWTRENTG